MTVCSIHTALRPSQGMASAHNTSPGELFCIDVLRQYCSIDREGYGGALCATYAFRAAAHGTSAIIKMASANTTEPSPLHPFRAARVMSPCGILRISGMDLATGAVGVTLNSGRLQEAAALRLCRFARILAGRRAAGRHGVSLCADAQSTALAVKARGALFADDRVCRYTRHFGHRKDGLSIQYFAHREGGLSILCKRHNLCVLDYVALRTYLQPRPNVPPGVMDHFGSTKHCCREPFGDSMQMALRTACQGLAIVHTPLRPS